MPKRTAMATTIAEMVRSGARSLRPSESSRLDSELLLAHTLGLDRLVVYRDGDREVAADQGEQFERLIRARADGRPVAQLLGVAEFWSLSFQVDPHVLIPRAETEVLVAVALDRIPRSGRPVVADVGTGSGAIAVALAVERPGAAIVASDLSAAALLTARRNCERHRVAGVHLLQADWMDGLGDVRFDAIVSNPPYVCADDPLLAISDIRFEPRLALVGGRDGLGALRAFVAQARGRLKPGGFLAVEHGYNQGPAVRRLFEAQGLRRVATVRDVGGLERVTHGENGCRR
jgi:release factor glutamine methyltransferase